MRNSPRLLTAFGIIMLLLSIPSVQAQTADTARVTNDTTFISFNGKFFVHFPSRWKQVDYTTVDYYQKQSGGVMDYEAIFAPPTANPFFHDDYLVIQVDTIGPMTPTFIDTMLNQTERQSHIPIARVAQIGNLATELKVGTAIYDQGKKNLWILTDLVDRENAKKRNLMGEHYYERGIARFIFYAPDSLYASLLPQFEQVLNSFGSENYEAKIPKAEAVVADTTTFKKESGGNNRSLYLMIAVAIAIAAALLFRVMKRS